MPTSRCPRSNGFHWITGYLYQDLENDFSFTKVSSNAHFRGWVLNDVARYFCIKNHSSSAVDTNRKSWPAGQYCIYQKGSSCPAGMQSGSVLWDDENVANGTNKNRNSGSLPAGVYNQDTKIFFCCQTAGSTGNPIELPIDKPFYLIALTPDCQRVLNAVHTKEYIVYDTEDDNNHDQQTFPFPFGADYPEPRICYCYYQGTTSFAAFFYQKPVRVETCNSQIFSVEEVCEYSISYMNHIWKVNNNLTNQSNRFRIMTHALYSWVFQISYLAKRNLRCKHVSNSL